MHDRGFALLIVAIAVLTLSLIFAAALDTARQHLAATAAELERVKLLAAVDGAIVTAEHDLAAARVIAPTELSAPRAVKIGDTDVELSVRPEGAKLDLNAAQPALLDRYFTLSGLDQGTSRDLVGRIVARRKKAAVSVTTTRYENRAQYLFQTVAELGDLKGVSPDILACVGPDLTVFTGTPFVDSAHASPRLRAAMELPPDLAPARATSAAVTTGRAIVAGEIFEITARAKAKDSRQAASRQTIVRVTGNLGKPVWVLAQTTPAPDSKESQAACNRLRPKRNAARNE